MIPALSMIDGELKNLGMTAAVGIARVAPSLYFLPYLKQRLVGSMMLRGAVVVIVAMGFAPLSMTEGAALFERGFVTIIVREAGIGFALGFAMGLPFWVAMAAGEFIDNQRGATISSTIDPAVGIKASLFASFFNLFWAAAFAISGGIRLACEAIAQSYVRFPVGARFDFTGAFVLAAIELLTATAMQGVILAAPMIIAMYLSEIALGLMSRFASQLNPFSVAMSVKSSVMLLVLSIYFGSVMPERLMSLFEPYRLFAALSRAEK